MHSKLPSEDYLLRRRVVTEAEAAHFVSLSLPHLRRLRREGRGPRHVAVSERRIGYRIADLEAWIQARLVENG